VRDVYSRETNGYGLRRLEQQFFAFSTGSNDSAHAGICRKMLQYFAAGVHASSKLRTTDCDFADTILQFFSDGI